MRLNIYNQFIDYVMSFYSYNGIYDMQATREEVWNALAMRLNQCTSNFYGDSVDRELVRDIIIAERQNKAG